MHTYRFSFSVAEEISDDQVEQLFEAGCDDCSPHRSRGQWVVDFDRESANFDEAISTAREQVRSCGLTVTGLTVEADAVQAIPSGTEA